MDDNDICNDWYGVTCSSGGVPVELELQDVSLSGTLPTELGALTDL